MRASQCWKTDALVESTKKGSPILLASNSSSHPSGLPSGGATDPARIMKGSTRAGAARTAACRRTCCRRGSHRDAPKA